MRLFRSEEHVERHLGDRPRGVLLPVATLAALALAWWGDRLDPAWRPHTREQNQAILDRLGLTGDFWRLP
jgi:hypothetical protein